MSFDLNGIVQTLDSKLHRVELGARVAMKTKEGQFNLIGKTVAAVVASMVFFSILGASAPAVIFVSAIVGFSAFCYVATQTDPVSAGGIARTAAQAVTDLGNKALAKARKL